MWIARDIHSRLQRLAAERPAVVLTGARLAGNLAAAPAVPAAPLRYARPAGRRSAGPGRVRRVLRALARAGDRRRGAYAPGLFRHLKPDVDAHRGDKGRFLLTGPQTRALLGRVSESLAERVAVLELEPLSWREILRTHHDVRLEEALLRGGYPELWAEPPSTPLSTTARIS